ncbi:hypothetical protein ABD76_21905 [Paenibacillus dendritiformis]|uniref:hypothetical protein n=1 Tax=Paenibacillus dendritiformis TaxID=130049 RepID=UPI0018CD8633|nr:hypothetical protein [Paenibacillus dendritiformis]MBG9794975.1 hypothetical protein [Paenibacillus dendritiformis]
MRNIARFAVLLCAMMWVVAGCGNSASQEGTVQESAIQKTTQESQQPAAADSGSAASFPRTVAHVVGETVIEAKPMKIATPYISFVDYMAMLDAYPVAARGVDTIERNFPNHWRVMKGCPARNGANPL